MPIYKKSIDCALRHIQVARDNFAFHHAEDFDIDWAMEKFENVIIILEQMRDYMTELKEGDPNEQDR